MNISDDHQREPDSLAPETAVKCARDGCTRFVDIPVSWLGTEREVGACCDSCSTVLLSEALSRLAGLTS